MATESATNIMTLTHKEPAAIIDLTADDADLVLTKPEDASTQQLRSDADPNDHWETDSMYEDLLEEIHDDCIIAGPDSCSVEEARLYRERLLEIGPERFILETISARKITAKKLCTAFRIQAPTCFEGLPDDAYYQLLGLLISRELSQRRRLSQHKTIDDAAALLRTAKNVMVITGAGISTSLGIPDFRSKNTGFYSKLRDMGYSDPEEVFDIHNFDEDPTTFYSLAGDILPDLHKWTPTHEFIHLLQLKGKLLTNYTQNIDNLEGHAGIDPAKLMQCHGSWATATCRKCQHKIPGELIFEDIKAQRVSRCQRCERELAQYRPGRVKRKRSSNGSGKSRKKHSSDDDSDGAYDIPEAGVMKPDITFFGEGLPKQFFERLRKQDREVVDLVVVIGTSMKVAPVSEIPHIIPRHVPQIFISREPVTHINFDINLLGDCDTVVAELCARAGWALEHNMLPDNFKADVEQDGDRDYQFKVKLRNTEAVEKS